MNRKTDFTMIWRRRVMMRLNPVATTAAGTRETMSDIGTGLGLSLSPPVGASIRSRRERFTEASRIKSLNLPY